MSPTGYLILAIVILVVLLAIFFISFVLYKRTPVPKGCEDIQISDENCMRCAKHSECNMYKQFKEEEK